MVLEVEALRPNMVVSFKDQELRQRDRPVPAHRFNQQVLVEREGTMTSPSAFSLLV